MIAKVWQDARWKSLIATFLFVALAATNLLTYEEVIGNVTSRPTQEVDLSRQADKPAFVSYALHEMMYGNYALGGKPILAAFAILLGIGLILGEANQGTVYLILSKPMSRTRLLMTKYAVGATLLLAVASIGNIGLIISAAEHGYPLRYLSVWGIALSTVLLWLGSLSVLSLASLTSVVLRSLIGAGLTAVLALCLVFNLSGILDVLLYNLQDVFKIQDSQGVPTYFPYGPSERLNLANYWTDASLYLGQGFAVTTFLVCLIAAAAPLLAALWMFRRKAY